MMQGEKVAADIREAHENLSGDSAILPVLSAISRRLQRRLPQAPGLIEPSVQALDEAMQALETATQAVEVGARRLRLRSARTRAMRGAPVRAARHGAQTCDDGRQSARARAQIRRRSRRARARAKCASSRSRPRRAPPPPSTPAPPTRCRTPAPPPRARWRRRSTPSCRRSSSSGRASPSRSSATNRRLCADGYDRAEFTVQTNPGSRPGPLMKVASGGELARFLLALKVSLAERDTAPTLVFDEIDTGVGGAVADAIGQRLARLAAKAQVLAVTHAPQVAARSQPAFPDRQERRRQGRTRRDPGARARRLGPARRDRPHARRRRDHRRGAAGGQEPDRKGGIGKGGGRTGAFGLPGLPGQPI